MTNFLFGTLETREKQWWWSEQCCQIKSDAIYIRKNVVIGGCHQEVSKKEEWPPIHSDVPPLFSNLAMASVFILDTRSLKSGASFAWLLLRGSRSEMLSPVLFFLGRRNPKCSLKTYNMLDSEEKAVTRSGNLLNLEWPSGFIKVVA